MIFLLAGEGPSDLGQCKNQKIRCSGQDFELGPLTEMVRQIVDRELSRVDAGWGLPNEAIEFLEHAALTEVELAKAQPTSSLLPGRKDKQRADDIYFYQEARVLGHLARVRANEAGCAVSAILFHDADGRRSSKSGEWQEKAKSMRGGFANVGHNLGVPMVANPTSEAWLLCGLKDAPYQNCAALEDNVSASDKSPRWVKKLLKDVLANRGLGDVSFGDLVSERHIDCLRIDMPSFNAFRDRLVEVVAQIVPQHPLNRH